MRQSSATCSRSSEQVERCIDTDGINRSDTVSVMKARIIGVTSLIEWIYRSDLRRLMSAPVWVIGRRIESLAKVIRAPS